MLRTRARSLARMVATAAVTASMFALTAGAGSAAAASPSGTLGLYTGARDVSGVQDFGSWVGKPVGNVLDFLPKTDWSKVDSPTWWTSGWSMTSHSVEYSVPMIPNTGGTLQAGAAGQYNSHFASLAKALVAGGQANVTLRLGWEFNGAWYKWTAKDDPAAYAAYWRQIVDTMRSVPGQAFKFDWCPTAAKGAVAPDLAYPGDPYVDYVGQDFYDQSWIANYNHPQARWQDYLTRPYGLEWHRSFSAAHNKPMTYPEWGLAIRPDGHGGGDSAFFIEQMHDWIVNNNVAFHHYFEIDGSDGITHTLMGGKFPQGAAKFRELFGPTDNGLVSTTTVVQPPTGHGKKPRARRISGQVHNGSRGTVALRLERRGKGGWHRIGVGHDRVNQRGKFRKSMRFVRHSRLKHGSYRLQAHYLGSGDAKPSTSRYRRFKIS